MWKVLAPLITLVVVLLIQMQVAESFANATTDSSGNKVDASGNKVDSSGNQVSSTINLTLADLLTLFKLSQASQTSSSSSSTSSDSSTSSSSSSSTPTEVINASDFYSEIRPELVKDIKGIVGAQLAGSPYSAPDSLSCGSPCSDSAAQGSEYQTAMKDMIRKDEVPCWGCSL